MSTYEWGVLRSRGHDEPHREGMTEKEARAWIADWEEMGGTPGTFVLIRRLIGEWEEWE